MLARSLLFLSTPSLCSAEETPFKTVGAMGADYPSVKAAIDAVPAGNPARKVIFIQPGAFFGHTVLDIPFVTLRGSGPGTLLTFNLRSSVSQNTSATVPVPWLAAGPHGLRFPVVPLLLNSAAKAFSETGNSNGKSKIFYS